MVIASFFLNLYKGTWADSINKHQWSYIVQGKGIDAWSVLTKSKLFQLHEDRQANLFTQRRRDSKGIRYLYSSNFIFLLHLKIYLLRFSRFWTVRRSFRFWVVKVQFILLKWPTYTFLHFVCSELYFLPLAFSQPNKRWRNLPKPTSCFFLPTTYVPTHWVATETRTSKPHT